MIAGLTGHQTMGDDQTIQWVRSQLSALVTAEGVSEGLMSLAAGADQMFATLLLQQGLPYSVVVPCEEYAGTFSKDERQTYSYLLSKARSVVVLEFARCSEAAFYEAGKNVVTGCDLLIAVWDGLAARGLGGTADIVHFAQSHSKRVLHVDTTLHAVRSI